MELDCLSRIKSWPTPESVWEVQVFLRFAITNRRFIRQYAQVTTPISNLLKTPGSRNWEWTREAVLA
jgi:hypothetical protein